MFSSLFTIGQTIRLTDYKEMYRETIRGMLMYEAIEYTHKC